MKFFGRPISNVLQKLVFWSVYVCVLIIWLVELFLSSSFVSKTIRTTHQVFLVALPITYFVRFIVLMYVLVTCIKVDVFDLPVRGFWPVLYHLGLPSLAGRHLDGASYSFSKHRVNICHVFRRRFFRRFQICWFVIPVGGIKGRLGVFWLGFFWPPLCLQKLFPVFHIVVFRRFSHFWLCCL